jgi:Fic family protein
MYIYDHADWPHFFWDAHQILSPLSEAAYHHGELSGRMHTFSHNALSESNYLVTAQSIVSSSAIEGEHLDIAAVRSSIARQLSLPYRQERPADHSIDAIVEMSLDATQHYDQPLTLDRLLLWHSALFPTGYSGMRPVVAGRLRDDRDGRMQVISHTTGPLPIIHFEAPVAAVLEAEIHRFLSYVNDNAEEHPFIKAAVAHLWFITLHPFEDGNGRIGRAIIDYLLARSEKSSLRYYSVSSQIQQNKELYYELLERTQKGSMDITLWVVWFLTTLSSAFKYSSTLITSVLRRQQFWREAAHHTLSCAQRTVMTRYLGEFQGNLTSSKYAKLAKVSQDTATRDLQDLVAKGLLIRKGGGRSTHYVLADEIED